MYIGYKNQTLEKICTDPKVAFKKLSIRNLNDLFKRLRDLGGFKNLADVPVQPPYRRHKLTGTRNKQWAIKLTDACRICFVPVGDYQKDENENPLLETVTEIEIVDIGDYH